MSKGYIVMERAYEYTDKTTAKSACDMINAKAFSGLCIGEYDECLYGNEDVFTDFDPTGKLVTDFGNVKATRLDDLKKIAKFFGDKYDIRFYVLREVDID
jgi:hypothetical protein